MSNKKVYYINQDKEVKCWSNFFQASVRIRGKVWPTTEHFFQAAKFFNTDPEWAEEISKADTPRKAARMGRSHEHPLDPNWEKGLKLQIMLEALLAKANNWQMLKDLLETEDAEIIERADWDDIWGDGPERNGTNFLGRLCMLVRDIKRKEIQNSPGGEAWFHHGPGGEW